MLHVHTSNRYECLRDALCGQLARSPDDPFVQQDIIIPSAAVKRDVQLSLAREFGVAAGLRFSFLAVWLWARIGQLVPDVRRESPFTPEKAMWRFSRFFEHPEDFQAHPGLFSYLQNADPVMRLELAYKIATLFETYITYRPDWLARWREGKRIEPLHAASRADEAWQMALWQRFAADLGTLPRHPADVFFEAMENLRDAGVASAGLPESTHLFALSTLPPLYLEILARLARWMDIHVYLVNPCREYWHELVTQKRQNRLEAAGRGGYLDDRHPLLAEWGGQTQALFSLILDAVADTSETHEIFQPPLASGTPTLLRRFQESLLDLDMPAPRDWPLSATDRSVEIHVAHSLTRQLEILRDQLAQRFDADSTLHPQDVLVALPDLDAAAPLIDAVFGEEDAHRRRLPYVITGRSPAQINPVARILLTLLELTAPPARLPANAVFALLQEPLVGEALALSESELERLHVALERAGAHWGLDGATRASYGLPETERHSWRDALARLLLGYAMPQDAAPFQGIVPADRLSGPDAELLGVLWRVLEHLESLIRAQTRAHTAAGWLRLWQGVLADWLPETPQNSEDAGALRAVHETLTALTNDMAEPDPATRIPAEVALVALKTAFQNAPRGGIPTGCVTFAALPSLRCLPYRLICLLNLNDGVFPRSGRPLEFDLMAQAPRPGDRQRRDDDRNLFLDMILAARDALYLSYSGRSQRDDSALPPSILVSELLEFCCRATGEPPERFAVSHPLQPFSPLYFRTQKPDLRLVSANALYAEALNHGKADEKTCPPFFGAPLPKSEHETSAVPDLAALQAFFRHPARASLKRLHVALNATETELADEEPLNTDFFAQQRLAERLLPFALSGAEDAELRAIARAGLEWPEGHLGDQLLEEELFHLRHYTHRLQPWLDQIQLLPLEFHIRLNGQNSFAQLRGVTPDGLLRHRYADAKAGDHIAAWLDHLYLAASGQFAEQRTLHIARDQTFHFNPVTPENARAWLCDWLAAWREGQTRILHFYPRTAWAWETESRSRAYNTWWSDFTERGEFDAWWALALRDVWANPGREALDADFHHWRETLLTPLCETLETEALAQENTPEP